MTNFHECSWYMKSGFIISCLARMKKTPLFMLEYKDISIYWIDKFKNFSICDVECGIEKFRKSKTGKILEMVLLPVTFSNDDDKACIEDQVCFVFEDVLQKGFCKYNLSEVSSGKMLLNFWEMKQEENILSFLVKSKGNGIDIFLRSVLLRS